MIGSKVQVTIDNVQASRDHTPVMLELPDIDVYLFYLLDSELPHCSMIIHKVFRIQ